MTKEKLARLISIIGLVLLIIVVIVIWIYTLKKQIRSKTAELQKAHNNLEVKVQDRTLRLQSTEKTLRQERDALLLRERAMSAVDTGVIITDAVKEGNPIVYVNEAVEKMTGYSPNEMIGRNPRFLQGDDHDQPELDQIRLALAATESVQVTLRNYRKDGTLFKVDLAISPVRSDIGSLTHFIGVQRDVTKKLDTEERLRQAQKNDAIGQLSGGIAHDFNNLLSVITGNLEFLSMDLKDDTLREYVDEANSAAQMGARLTGRLLRFARRGTLEPKVVNLNEQVLAAQQLLESTIGETISLSSNLCSDLWATRADPSEVENTVINLAVNARDAMPQGGTIAIETANVHVDEQSLDDDLGLTPGDYVKLSVTDNGSGMTDEVKVRIFEPFFTTKPTGKGTGLGLASIFGFAKQSGGHINVYSEVGHGTTVNVYLPRHALSVPVAENQNTPLSVIEPSSDGRRILVVEDNEMVRRVTVRRLGALGYDALQAESGPAAVKILETETGIELILSDVVMEGGMSGYDVARWVRRNAPLSKILLTSGFNEQMAEDGDVSVEDLQVLQKPYSLADLQQAVETALNKTSMGV